MAATLTLCASRKMLSSVCLLPMSLAFHCSMLNVLSDMVGVTRRWRRCAVLWWRPTGGTDIAIGSPIIRNVSKTRTSCMYPMQASCTQVAGTLASDVLEADRAVVLWRLLLLFAFQSMFILIWVSCLEITEFPDSVRRSAP